MYTIVEGGVVFFLFKASSFTQRRKKEIILYKRAAAEKRGGGRRKEERKRTEKKTSFQIRCATQKDQTTIKAIERRRERESEMIQQHDVRSPESSVTHTTVKQKGGQQQEQERK